MVLELHVVAPQGVEHGGVACGEDVSAQAWFTKFCSLP